MSQKGFNKYSLKTDDVGVLTQEIANLMGQLRRMEHKIESQQFRVDSANIN